MKGKVLNYMKYLVIGLVIIIALVILVLLVTHDNVSNKKDDVTIIEDKDINYSQIDEKIKNKDSFVIYYYDNTSDDKYNLDIKKYLDDLGLDYYLYNHSRSDDDNNRLLELLDMDKELFGYPAIIYIKDGSMFANIININMEKVVKKFIEDYDLLNLDK